MSHTIISQCVTIELSIIKIFILIHSISFGWSVRFDLMFFFSLRFILSAFSLKCFPNYVKLKLENVCLYLLIRLFSPFNFYAKYTNFNGNGNGYIQLCVRDAIHRERAEAMVCLCFVDWMHCAGHNNSASSEYEFSQTNNLRNFFNHQFTNGTQLVSFQ